MFSLQAVKDNFYAFFRVLSTTNSFIDIAYKGRMYRLAIEDLGKEAPPRKYKTKKRAIPIKKSKCAQCGGLMLNGVCMAAVKHG